MSEEGLNSQGNWKDSGERIAEVLRQVKEFWERHPDKSLRSVVLDMTTENNPSDCELWQWLDYSNRRDKEKLQGVKE